MATIIKRRRKDGSTGYTAIIRLKQHGKIIYQETNTFSRLALAEAWSSRRELELETPGAIERAKIGELSLGALISRYRNEYEEFSKWQRSKTADLKRLEQDEIAKVDALKLTTQVLVDHVRRRRRDGAGPSTAAADLTWIAVVLKTAKAAWGLPVHPEYVAEARQLCRDAKLTGLSKKRTRRPTADELARLDQHLSQHDGCARLPMREIMWFAIHSARRQAEICRIEWSDNDPASMTGMVRDAKHPRHKEGNHRRFKYTQHGWDIAQRQPQGSPFIFPHDSRSVGAAFHRACKFLKIHDLRFHDLRHEATSKLFESGYPIQEVAMFTLHESWAELKRYTQIEPAKVKLRD